MGCGGIEVRMLNSQLIESGFKPSCCHFVAWAIWFTSRCLSYFSSKNKYLVIDIGGYLCTNSLRTVIAAWLNTSQRSRDGVQMNRSARE